MEENKRIYKQIQYRSAQKAYQQARKNGMDVMDAHNVYTREFYQCRKDMGLCVRCGTKVKHGRTLCEACTAMINQRVKRMNANGLCVCGAPVRPGKKSCEMCAKVAHIRYLQRKAAKQNEGQGNV